MSLRVANFITKIERKKREREDTNRFGNLGLLQLKFWREFGIGAKTLVAPNLIIFLFKIIF